MRKSPSSKSLSTEENKKSRAVKFSGKIEVKVVNPEKISDFNFGIKLFKPGKDSIQKGRIEIMLAFGSLNSTKLLQVDISQKKEEQFEFAKKLSTCAEFLYPVVVALIRWAEAGCNQQAEANLEPSKKAFLEKFAHPELCEQVKSLIRGAWRQLATSKAKHAQV